MPDAHIRNLERLEPGSARHLRERMRRGLVDRKRVELAAAMGHEAAKSLVGLSGQLAHLFPWQSARNLLDDRILRHLACDYAEHVMPSGDQGDFTEAIRVSRAVADGLLGGQALSEWRLRINTRDWFGIPQWKQTVFYTLAGPARACFDRVTSSALGAARLIQVDAWQRRRLAAYILGETERNKSKVTF